MFMGPPLLEAVKAGSISEVKDMLAAGADVNIRHPHGNLAALHIAALNGHSRETSALLDYGADKDALDDASETPLIKASMQGHQPVVEILLAAGADVNIFSTTFENAFGRSFGATALHMAAGEGWHGIVSLLLEEGADTDALDNRGYTPLVWAIGGGYHLPIVKNLLKAGASLNIRSTDAEGLAALHFAADRGQTRVVSMLLESGASKDIVNELGETPLSRAVAGGHLRVVETLLAFGADVTIPTTDHTQDTPLHNAAGLGRDDIVSTFLAWGADADVRRSSDGCTTLHLAAGGGFHEVVSTLLRKGACKDVRDFNGRTPLLWATAEGDLPAVERLLAAGARVNIRSKDQGFSALHLGAGKGNEGIVSALLRSGAHVDVVDHNGDTALMWAAGFGHARVVDVLLAACADLSIRNNVEGYSALDWATTGGHAGVQEAIRERLAGGNPNNWYECTGKNLAADSDQADATQASIDDDFDFCRGGQTETVGSGSLAEDGGGNMGGVLAVPAWLDVEGVCLAIALMLWFQCRCKPRS